MKINSICFVCLGNICRSPMCQSIMTDILKKNGMSHINVDSFGTSNENDGYGIYPATKNILYKKGVPIIPHMATQMQYSDYNDFDLIIGLDHNNVRNLLRLFKGDPDNKVKLLLSFSGEDRAVSDPWWTGDFETAYNDCLKGCTALLDYIKQNNK